MTLREQQILFATLLGQFLVWCYSKGYDVTLGEAYRPPETAALYARQGRGSKNSLHCQRLAVDLCLFVHDTYQTRSEYYEPLGIHWESMHPLCRWGGRFSTPDGNHFSLTWKGRA